MKKGSVSAGPFGFLALAHHYKDNERGGNRRWQNIKPLIENEPKEFLWRAAIVVGGLLRWMARIRYLGRKSVAVPGFYNNWLQSERRHARNSAGNRPV